MSKPSRPLLGVALAGAIAPAALPAPSHAEPIISPGVVVAVHHDEDAYRWGVGGELTAYPDPRDWPWHGALLQLEFFQGGGIRLAIGYQITGEGMGAEAALSLTRVDGVLRPGIQLAPWLGIGYVNAAARLILEPDRIIPGGAFTLKVPMADGEPISGDRFFGDVQVGRPLRDAAGHTLRPAVRIIGRRRLPDAVARLPGATRRALGRAWLDDARDEYAAVAAFRRLAADLAANDAPRALVRRAEQAAIEEDRHARGCFAVAGALLGLRLRPIPIPPGATPPPGLAELAAASVTDGEQNEGRAARLAERGSQTARPAPVRDLLGTITREETGHATLARDIRRWTEAVGGREVHRAVERARDSRPPPSDAMSSCPAGAERHWIAWGRVLPDDARRVMAEVG